MPECAFSSNYLSVEISALVTFLSNDMGSATEWRLRREQLRRDGNLNGCDGAHRHTQPLKRISFIIKWLYLFQFFLYCIVFFVFVLKVLIFTLTLSPTKTLFLFGYISSLKNWRWGIRHVVFVLYIFCIWFAHLSVFLLYLFCISSLSSLRSPRWVVP